MLGVATVEIAVTAIGPVMPRIDGMIAGVGVGKHVVVAVNSVRLGGLGPEALSEAVGLEEPVGPEEPMGQEGPMGLDEPVVPVGLSMGYRHPAPSSEPVPAYF